MAHHGPLCLVEPGQPRSARTYSMKRRIPTVNVAVAITVPTIHRMNLVSRFAISVRTPA